MNRSRFSCISFVNCIGKYFGKNREVVQHPIQRPALEGYRGIINQRNQVEISANLPITTRREAKITGLSESGQALALFIRSQP